MSSEIIKIDLRGLSCPEPVLKTKKTFDDPTIKKVEAIVDDEVSVRNLTRLASYLKASVTSTNLGKGFSVEISRGEMLPLSSTQSRQLPSEKTNTVIFISKDEFGKGDAEFSRTLMNMFLQTYFESGLRPSAILMANSGVKLMQKNSPALKVLDDFKSNGVEVAACGLCVEYYGLKDDVPKEQITNMFTICEYLAAADKVITP